MNQLIYQMHRKHRKNQITIQEWWDFIATLDNKEELKEVVMHWSAADSRLRIYKDSYRFRNKIRAFCNELGYTDVYPYEVVRVVSPTCVEVRALDTKQLTSPQKFYPGGFSGHYADNYNQTYEYISNEQNGIKRLKLGKKGWGLGKFRMADAPYKFHDYNF